jgi:hypothetical protein
MDYYQKTGLGELKGGKKQRRRPVCGFAFIACFVFSSKIQISEVCDL